MISISVGRYYGTTVEPQYFFFYGTSTVEVTVLASCNVGKSSESVQLAITGPCLRMRHRPSTQHTVPIRKICRNVQLSCHILAISVALPYKVQRWTSYYHGTAIRQIL